MGLEHADFQLTNDELARINQFISERAEAFAAEGEDAAMELRVVFDFVVNYGRSISISYGGAVQPTVVVEFPS